MVDPTRLELVTSSMSRKRSNQLSYGSKLPQYCIKTVWIQPPQANTELAIASEVFAKWGGSK